MTETLNTTDRATPESNRLDVIAFVATFAAGCSLYFSLRWLGASQLAISGGLVGIMVGYAFVITRLPRLRLRLDQTGDNSYYLGLLFTLMSMATALHDFGASELSAGDDSSARQIISNFGVALATTITGILLRVVLHQMRVDPAEIEETARLELSDAANRVRATLDRVSAEMERLIADIRQRAGDNLAQMIEETNRTLGDFVSQVTGATSRLTDAASDAHNDAVTKMAMVSQRLTEVASATEAAAVRLRSVEPPPTKLATRIEAVAEALAKVAGGAELVGGSMTDAGQTSAKVAIEMLEAAAKLSETASGAIQFQQATAEHLNAALTQVGDSIQRLGGTIEEDRQRLAALERQSRATTEAANQAGEASTAVLRNLVEVTRGLTDLLRAKV